MESTYSLSPWTMLRLCVCHLAIQEVNQTSTIMDSGSGGCEPFSHSNWLQKMIELEQFFQHNGWIYRLIGQEGDLDSTSGRVIPKTLKMVFDTSLLNTQQYKVRIKGKVEQFRERSSAFPYTSM